MRDVIIAGAGGGGAVIAKELAAQGLDVLLLEAGPRFGNLESDWSHFESDANGLFGRSEGSGSGLTLLTFDQQQRISTDLSIGDRIEIG